MLLSVHRRTAALCVLLAAAMLTACGDSVSVPEQTGVFTAAGESTSVTDVTAGTSESAQTKETAAQTSEAASGTTVSQTAAQTDTTPQTDASRTEPAPDTTAKSETTSAASSQTTTTKAAEPAQHLFDGAAPGKDCTAYVTAHTDYQLDEADSCLGDGKDRTYSYADFTIISYYENGRDIVQEIDISGKSVKTREGISVGMNAAAVQQAYGAPGAVGYIYETADGTLEFVIDGDSDTVAAISLYSQMDN